MKIGPSKPSITVLKPGAINTSPGIFSTGELATLGQVATGNPQIRAATHYLDTQGQIQERRIITPANAPQLGIDSIRQIPDAEKSDIEQGISGLFRIVGNDLVVRSLAANSPEMGRYKDITLGNETISMHYQILGEKNYSKTNPRTIVLLHGQPCSMMSFRRIADELAEHYRVLILDLPGMGYSGCPEDKSFYSNMQTAYVPLLEKFFSEVLPGGLTHPAFVGVSWGSYVTQELLAYRQNPNDISFLFGSPGPGKTLTKSQLLADIADKALTANDRRASLFWFKQIAKVGLPSIMPKGRVRDHDINEYMNPFLNGEAGAARLYDQRFMIEHINRLTFFPHGRQHYITRLGQITEGQMFMLHGDHDDVVSYQLGKSVPEFVNCPVQFVTLEGYNHDTPNEDPKLATHAILYALKFGELPVASK